MKKGLILDIDTASQEQVDAITRCAMPGFWGVKLGDRFVFEGAHNVMRRLAKGTRVFADLKHYDTEDRLRRLVAGYASLGEYAPHMLTVCGERHVKAIRAATQERGEIEIIMTSYLSDDNFSSYVGDPEDLILEQLDKALESGVQGITCPAWLLHEVVGLEEHLKIVATGIRSKHVGADNHANACTPHHAFTTGATFAVVGREVLQAASPIAYLRKLIAACNA